MRSITVMTWAVSVVAGAQGALGQTVTGADIPARYAGLLVAQQGLGTSVRNSTYPGHANGSELDALFVNPDISGGRLRIAITGNIEDTDNTLEGRGIVILLQARAGGQNVLGANGGFHPFGERYIPNLVGTRFDAGFSPSYGIMVNASGAGFNEYFVNTLDLTNSSTNYIGRGVDGATGSTLQGGNNPTGWVVALNNANTDGVAATLFGAADGNALTASRGLELSIPAADLGLAPGSIMGIQVLINSGSLPGFVSNQNLPSLPAGTIGLGNAPINYTLIGGDQFARVTIVPSPTLGALVGVAAVVGGVRRRRV